MPEFTSSEEETSDKELHVKNTDQNNVTNINDDNSESEEEKNSDEESIHYMNITNDNSENSSNEENSDEESTNSEDEDPLKKESDALKKESDAFDNSSKTKQQHYNDIPTNWSEQYGHNSTRIQYPPREENKAEWRARSQGIYNLPKKLIPPNKPNHRCPKHFNLFDPEDEHLKLNTKNIIVYSSLGERVFETKNVRLGIISMNIKKILGLKLILRLENLCIVLWINVSTH